MGILTGIWLTLAGCGAPKAQVIMEAETAAADGTETQAGPVSYTHLTLPTIA